MRFHRPLTAAFALSDGLAVVDFVDDVGRYFVTAVGKDAVTFCTRNGVVSPVPKAIDRLAGISDGFEAEALDILLRVADADRHQDADGYHVFGRGQSLTQRDVTGIAAVRVFLGSTLYRLHPCPAGKSAHR